MKRIIRDRKLTPEEIEKYKKIRDALDKEIKETGCILLNNGRVIKIKK